MQSKSWYRVSYQSIMMALVEYCMQLEGQEKCSQQCLVRHIYESCIFTIAAQTCPVLRSKTWFHSQVLAIGEVLARSAPSAGR